MAQKPDSKKPEIIIVIPTYNEAGNLRDLVHGIDAHLRHESYRVFFIDDGSPDGTANLAEELSAKYPITVFRRAGKLGLGTAYIFGYKEAFKQKPTYIVSMDADLSHDPKYLPQLLTKARLGVDIVLGSRYVPGGGVENWGIHRKIMSKGANGMARLFLGVPAHDLTGAFRCFRREVLESLELDSIKSNGYSFLEEILYLAVKKGYKIAEVPIMFKDREIGKSKLSRKEMVKFFWTLIRLRFFR